MAHQGYGGPTSLAYSKYAHPGLRKAQPAGLPAAVSSTPSSPANAIATREQIAASNGDIFDPASESGGAQLAAARGQALKEEVDKHATKLSSTVSTAVTNTRRLLELVREAVDKEDSAALKSVDALWTELELLFKATKGSKAALTNFLEKQRNNMALYHSSVVNETYRETQDQLDMERKKSNVQNNLILEQQQAFMDHKERTDTKLKEIEILEEKASRLTLANGHYKGELDDYKKKLQQEESTKQEDLKKTADLREEIEKLVASKKQLLAETERLRKTVDELEEKNQINERRVTDKYVAELKEKSALVEKATAKIDLLNKSHSTLQERENSGKNEMAKLRAENKQLSEKSANMAAEHSRAFQKNNEQTKKIESVTTENERFRKENGDLKERLKQIPELEKKNAGLFNEKSGLLEQVGNLSMELKAGKEANVKVNKELAATNVEITKAQLDRDAEKAENANLVAKMAHLAAESEKTKARLEGDIAKLKAEISELRTTQAAPAVGGGSITSAEKAAFEQKIATIEEQKAKSQSALAQWQKLAKDSYNEYKEMLPLYKEAETIRNDALKKDDEIKILKTELAKAKTSQSNGGGGAAAGEAAYWKGKYENLLASVGN